jgi:hypothetical protein
MTTPRKPTTRKPRAKPKLKPVQVVDTPEGKTVQVHFGFKATDAKKVGWTFAQAFVGSYTVGTGSSALTSVSQAKVATFSAAVAGVSAAVSAAKNFILDDDSPLK